MRVEGSGSWRPDGHVLAAIEVRARLCAWALRRVEAYQFPLDALDGL